MTISSASDHCYPLLDHLLIFLYLILLPVSTIKGEVSP